MAVEAIDNLGLLHRDIKPQSILLDKSGNCRLSDFGLACQMGPYLRQKGGTRGYWAPEVTFCSLPGAHYAELKLPASTNGDGTFS